MDIFKGTKVVLMNILIVSLLFLVSCKKGELVNEITPPVVEEPIPTVKPAEPVPVPSNATVYDFGGASDNLTIDGSKLNLAKNSLIRIAAGTYKSINLKNINGTVENPVFIKNNGQVIVTESMVTENLQNVTISGDNVTDITYGIKFENISYRAISMYGKMNGVTLKSMSFKNIGNYTISGDVSNSNNAYNGTAETRTENFKILNCLFDAAGSIVFGGALDKDLGIDKGFFKNVEIANNIFQNSPNVGAVCSFNNVQDYNIHNNTINNINQSNDNHNGVFSMQGNGTFHDNKLTNYQGNSIRMWVYSRGNSPVTCEIYNNVCYNTRKYSAFEIQGFDRNIYPGKSTYSNAKVYNNTAGSMNVSKSWEGQLLDLYNYGGTLEYYNNLGYNLFTANVITDMINNMSTVKIINKANNKYVSQQSDAVNDNTTFASKYSGVGYTAR